ncbi:MAG: hypothetical protein WC734_03955 [Patescibacteria group bacterium]|jgi:hypothetical protein
MPSDICLQTLLRKEPLSVEEWAALLEDTQRRIVPFLNKTTLATLGSLVCFHELAGSRRLIDDSPNDINAPLATQGIFGTEGIKEAQLEKADDFDQRGGLSPREIGGSTRAWGLCRSGSWWLITVHFQTEYDGRRQATEVSSGEVSAQTLLSTLAVHPSSILDSLWRTVNKWIEHRQAQLDWLQRLEGELKSTIDMAVAISPLEIRH